MGTKSMGHTTNAGTRVSRIGHQRRLVWIIALLALIAGVAGCFPSIGPFGPCGTMAESPPASCHPFIVNAEADSVLVGEVIALTAQQLMSSPYAYMPVWARWSSSDTSVATVENGYREGRNVGLVRAKRVGRVTITASDDHGNKARTRVKVLPVSGH